ncbi:MAG: sulfotransferase [Desulfobacteraceae bacterium]|nr:MAG: sulfotransferase [Desulfobacteraceae bacterium]
MADIHVGQPIYVTGLARSGSTLLLELLNQHPDLTAHRYQDYPLLFTPYMWNRYLERTPQDNTRVRERTHRDGIFITPESPEAFEEVLWTAFFSDLHDPAQSAILDEETQNQAFENFYRDHIRKLLLVRGRRRYLAKGNYNITRLSYLLKLFEDARFVIPVREPIWHVASLMKQHRRFCQGQQLNPRALTHLQRIGHFEFGLDRRPINPGDPERVAHIIDLWESGAEVEGWARYWALIHDFLADQLSSKTRLRTAVRIVRYEDFCRSPVEGVHTLFEHCRLSGTDMLMADVAGMIRPPALSKPEIFTNNDLAIIERSTSASAHRLGLGRTL